MLTMEKWNETQNSNKSRSMSSFIIRERDYAMNM